MFYIYANGTLIYHLANSDLYLNKPKLTLEMGKAGSLEFGILPDHAYYDRLSQLSTIVTVEYDNTEIFRGRVLSNTRDFQNMRTVYCEGDLAFLIDTVQKFQKYDGTVHALFRQLIANHNSRIKDVSKQFTVGNITVENRSIKLTGQDDSLNVGNIDYKQIAINSTVDEWNTTFDMIQTCIIDYVGGYLRTRRQNGVTYIDLLAPPDSSVTPATQEIELGVNMIDFEEEISAEDLFTVLIPLGDDNLTIASVNGGSDELVDTNAVAQYGRIVKTHVFNNVNEASTLLENGRRYLASNVNVPTTLTVNALDLHIISPEYDALHLCDRVHIKSTAHSIVEYLTCTKIEYDLENPGNDTYTFGNPTQTLTQRYREDKRKESDTYGNSASGGRGGGGGGAAAAAEAVAEEVAEGAAEELENFYNAYIDVDPEHGRITLGALYDITENITRTLSDCGISMEANPEQANVNIHTLHQVVVDNTIDIANNATRIDQVSTYTEATIRLQAARIDGAETEIDENRDKIASLTLTVRGAPGNPGLVQSVASIDADIIELNGKVATLEANEASIDRLKSKISSITSLSVISGSVQGTWSVSGTLRGSSIVTGNDEPVYSYMHYHTLACDNAGVVTLGVATKTGPTSFNLADTKFYKDGVSAAKTEGAQSATLRSLGVKSVGSPYAYDNKKYIDAVLTWSVQATQGDGTLYTTSDDITKAIDATGAYNQGVTDGVAKFRAKTVYIRGDSQTVYPSDGTSSGTNVGSSVDTTYLYVSWNGTTFSPWRPSSGVYYAGSSYTHNLRGTGMTRYKSGGSATYYEKIS